MIETQTPSPRSPLEPSSLHSSTTWIDSGAGFQLLQSPLLSCYSLQAPLAPLRQLAQSHWQLELPEHWQHRRLRKGDGQLWHCGGDQWLALQLQLDAKAARKLQSSKKVFFHDFSGACVSLRAEGSGARCWLQSQLDHDIGAPVFAVGSVTRARFARVQLTIAREATNSYRIICSLNLLPALLAAGRSVAP